jgi:hypothetical protein
MNEERTRKCLRQEEHILVPGRVSPVKTHKYTQLARQHRINMYCVELRCTSYTAIVYHQVNYKYDSSQ